MSASGLRKPRAAVRQVACLRYANDVSGGAHEAMWAAAAGGKFEYELEAAFVAHAMRHGLRHMGYPCIVGAGANAATLHYDRNKCAPGGPRRTSPRGARSVSSARDGARPKRAALV